MARIGLIDVDGHNYPNLALMKISAYHKSKGDDVEWWFSDLVHYDKVYKSKVFSDAYSDDVPDPMNADVVERGGSGYQIHLIDGAEIYDTASDHSLPEEIESMRPDYSIYPQYDFAVARTSAGCPRGCPFCIVASKEGRKSVKVSDVSQYWDGQKEIKVLDPNIIACKDCINLLGQYADTKVWVDFTQGIDARILTIEKIEALNRVKTKLLHFAWDDMRQSDSVLHGLQLYKQYGRIKSDRRLVVYVLTNYDTTHEDDLYRIYTLRDMGFDPFVMIYNKPSAPDITRKMARYVNNKFIFHAIGSFDEYQATGGGRRNKA